MLEIKSEKAKGNIISVLLAILKIQVRIVRTQNSSGSFTDEKKKSSEMLTDLQNVIVLWCQRSMSLRFINLVRWSNLYSFYNEFRRHFMPPTYNSKNLVLVIAPFLSVTAPGKF